VQILKSNHPKLWPWTAAGISSAGPDFIETAQALSNNTEEQNEYLDYLYREALYTNQLQIQVEFKNLYRKVRFLTGHKWDSESFGPREHHNVMIIGKIAGADENRTGRFLSGPPGEKLIEAFEQLGEYSWREAYITNLIRFTHPDKVSGGTLPVAWIKDCAPLLQNELRIVRPNYILCLGTDAIKHLFGKPIKATSAIGEIFELQIPLHKSVEEKPKYHTAKVVCCIHPAAVLRTPDMEQSFLLGLQGFVDLINGTTKVQESIEEHYIDNEADLSALVTEIMKDPANSKLSFDSEWQGERPEYEGSYLRTIQFSWHPNKACCVILNDVGGVPVFKPDFNAAIRILNNLTKKTSTWPVRIIGHFLRADLPWLISAGMKYIKDGYNAPEDDPDMSLPGAKYGWEKTKDEGGFDTSLAVHSHTEAGIQYKLEVLCNQLLGMPRYDRILQKYKDDYCKEHKLKDEQLEGYGFIPGEILHPYGLLDAIGPRRLFDLYNDKLLDCDRFGNNCREAFWIGQRASLSVLEMERTGILIDRERTEELISIYKQTKEDLVKELKKDANWPDFNASSATHCRELLFGLGYSGAIDKTTGKPARVSPRYAKLQNLTPIKNTKKPAKMWADIVARGETWKNNASTDKESLGELGCENPIAKKLRDIRFIEQLLRTNLKPAKIDKKSKELILDEDGEVIYEKGLLHYASPIDGRIHPRLRMTLETARYGCRDPNLQACAKRREDDYKRILGPRYKYQLRSVFMAKPGHVLIEADYSGAELYAVAIMARCQKMIEHCQRGLLKESDPNYYDIHSTVAVKAFKLNCAPTKSGLASIGKKGLRVAAKNCMFGGLYGRGAVAISRGSKEEGVDLTPLEAQALLDELHVMYPEVFQVYMPEAKARVHSPGWICTSFGRFRRFGIAYDRSVIGDLERQAGNFKIQAHIADSMSRALDHLYNYRKTRPSKDLWYDLLLQVHDAVILEVPFNSIEWVVDDVLPTCLSKRNESWPTDFDGVVYPDVKEPFHLGIDISVMLRWSEELNKEQAQALGIPLRFAHA